MSRDYHTLKNRNHGKEEFAELTDQAKQRQLSFSRIQVEKLHFSVMDTGNAGF